jgi:hypothetical protein
MVPLKGFRVVDYISSSSPKLAWRKGRGITLENFREMTDSHFGLVGESIWSTNSA